MKKKKPVSSAIAVAATLTSVGASAQSTADDVTRVKGSDDQTTDPLLGPPNPPDPPPRRAKKRSRQTTEVAESDEPTEPLDATGRTVEPLGFIGFSGSMLVTYLDTYGLPRIAPTAGVGLRFGPDAPHSAQLDVAIDLLGGTYSYTYIVSWYTMAATYLSFPLLARHRLSETFDKREHFTWGVQYSQRLGQSYHINVLGLPVGVYPVGGYTGYYGYSYYTATMPRNLLSLTVGYQARRVKPNGRVRDFELRLNAGAVRAPAETEFVGSFSLRWNLVPRPKPK